MITDAKRLRCGTILGALSHAGVKTAVVTAKDKLLKVLAYEMKGISFSSAGDGTPNVVYLEDELNSRFGAGAVRVICPIADPFVRHHGALGSFVRVHLRKAGDVETMIAFARTLPGVELVLDKEQMFKQFELPIDREGDFAVFSDRQTIVGARQEDHNLSQLARHRLRSHGGLGEQKVPFLLSRPINAEYQRRAKAGPLHNYDIFDFALNGVE